MKLSLIGKTARITAAVFMCGATWSAYAECPSIPTAQRFEINGVEVKDKTTGLIWQRCSVGQTWDGTTCKGQPTEMAQEEALKYAEKQSPWRLPEIKELTSLADKYCEDPAIDKIAFPNTPPDYYWSSTAPYPGLSDSAWYVDFYEGDVSGYYRDNRHPVRLVRTAP